MEAVFLHYSDPVACFIRGGFSFHSGGKLMRFVGFQNRFDLHDLMAETFRRAFEHRARMAYDGLAPYEAYLKRIARNLVIDRLRGDRRLVVDETAATVAADERTVARANAQTPEQAYQGAELQKLIVAFMGGLAPELRRFVQLRFQRELPQQTVAKEMNRTRRWVRTQEKRIRKRLLNHLRETGYDRRGGQP